MLKHYDSYDNLTRAVNVRVREMDYINFKNYCKEYNIKPSELLRGFIKEKALLYTEEELRKHCKENIDMERDIITYHITDPFIKHNVRTVLIAIGLDKNNYKLFIAYRVFDKSLTARHRMSTVRGMPKRYRDGFGRYRKMSGAILLQEVEDGKLKKSNDTIWIKIYNALYSCHTDFKTKFPVTDFLDRIYEERMGGFSEVTLEELNNRLYGYFNVKKIYKQILYYAELDKYREKLALKLEKRESENKEKI